MSSSVELNNEIEVQLLRKWAEAYEKNDISIIQNDLADDFRLRSSICSMYSARDVNDYFKYYKDLGITYRFEILPKPKRLGISFYALTEEDEEVLKSKTLCSKYMLVQYRSNYCDHCFCLCFNEENRITRIEEFLCDFRQLWFEF